MPTADANVQPVATGSPATSSGVSCGASDVLVLKGTLRGQDVDVSLPLPAGYAPSFVNIFGNGLSEFALEKTGGHALLKVIFLQEPAEGVVPAQATIDLPEGPVRNVGNCEGTKYPSTIEDAGGSKTLYRFRLLKLKDLGACDGPDIGSLEGCYASDK